MIAHVIGATVLGYFVLNEALQLVLDIGFIWTIYLDGQMLLLPQIAAVNELEVDAATRSQLNSEIELLEHEGRAAGLARITPAPVECLIKEVGFYENNHRRQLILTGEEADLVIETSLETAEIHVHGRLSDTP